MYIRFRFLFGQSRPVAYSWAHLRRPGRVSGTQERHTAGGRWARQEGPPRRPAGPPGAPAAPPGDGEFLGNQWCAPRGFLYGAALNKEKPTRVLIK